MSTGVEDPPVGCGAWIYRRVAADQHVYDEELQRRRPSSQAFIQDGRHGQASAYLESETTPDDAASEGPEPYMVRVRVGLLREKGLDVERDRAGGGAGHVNIVGYKRRSALNALVQAAERVPGYEPPDGDYLVGRSPDL